MPHVSSEENVPVNDDSHHLLKIAKTFRVWSVDVKTFRSHYYS